MDVIIMYASPMQKQQYLNFTLKHRKPSCLKKLPIMTSVLLGSSLSLKWAYNNNSKYSVLKLYSNVLCIVTKLSAISLNVAFLKKKKKSLVFG